ncbi:hypothetical protein CSO01_02020 [Cellulomonas soli]|uniref:Uncharacterized protein n=1 Tax=Cellulomonas soli TaxID=931535 RepID=A0A512P8G1_9CELL|nr:hypothetical protein CSO01_02020 [Cellulomonas soli]
MLRDTPATRATSPIVATGQPPVVLVRPVTGAGPAVTVGAGHGRGKEPRGEGLTGASQRARRCCIDEWRRVLPHGLTGQTSPPSVATTG